MPSDPKQLEAIKSVVWDYKVDAQGLLNVLLGLQEKEGPFNQEKIFLRVLERLPWHKILQILGREGVKKLLTPNRIAKLRFPEQRDRYERIRKILYGEPISFSGWDPRHREKYKRSLLSNRWHRFI